MDTHALMQLARSQEGLVKVLAAVGVLIGILAVVGLLRRGWASSVRIALSVLLVVGMSMAALGGYVLVHPSSSESASPSASAEAVVLEKAEAINEKEIGMLRQAPLEVSKQQADVIAPWPQWRGRNRDGISLETAIAVDWDRSPPKTLWKHEMGLGYSSFAVAGGRLYTMDAEGTMERVLCLDADTGEEIWSYRYPSAAQPNVPHRGPKATPTYFDGLVYTVGAGGEFHCFDERAKSRQAQVAWKHDLATEFDAAQSHSGYGFASSPLIEGDLVCVQPGGKKGSVVAFNRHDGKVVWSALNNMNGYSSPMAATIGGVRQIICFLEKSIAGVRASDGAKLWFYGWGNEYGGNIATPIIVGDYVFISAGHEDGCALLRVTADDKGSFKVDPVYSSKKLMRNHYSTCVYRDGYLYGFDVGPGNLKCIDLRTGAEKWADKRRPKGTLIYADGHLLVLTESGTLMSIKATPERMVTEGTVRGVAEAGDLWALPVLANGRLYVRDARNLICLDIRKRPAQ